MKILVTGAPGWLGTSLVKELVKNKKNKVSCLVLGEQDTSVLKKLKVKIVEGDLTKKESLSSAVKGMDLVYHCAGLIHPKKIKDLYQVNYIGTTNLIDEAIKEKVKKFIYISSNSPVGVNKKREQLFTEKTPYNPYLNYGRSKMLAEKYINKMFHLGKINTTIIRPCWFYGPNQPPRQTTFFKMIQKGNPLIFGDGKNLRSMSYIDNLIQGMLLAAKNKKANGQTYWIADEKPYQTIEIYKTVADILNVKLKPRFIPDAVSTVFEIMDKILQSLGLYVKEVHVAGEMNKDIACSIEKAKKELGYKPKVNLKEGMKKSIMWCRKEGLL